MKRSIPNIILSLIAIFTLAMGGLLFLHPPAIFPDPGAGFQVMRAMELGGPFNTLIQPDQSDIAKNTSEFLTWWTPGQYLFPWFFKWLSGINLGQAVAVSITLCQLLGLSGYFYVFKRLGFSAGVAAVSVAFVACQQFYVLPYLFYPGGEILLFAFGGWFLYGCVYFTKTGWQLALFVLLSGWLGFFCKSSVLWVYAAGCLFLWLRLSLAKRSPGEYVRNGLWIGVPAILSLISIYVLFLSRGQNPASASGGVKLNWQTFGFPLASPLLAGFSIDDLCHGLLFHSGLPLFSTSAAVLIIMLLAIVSLLIVWAIVRVVANPTYQLLLLVFYTVAIMFFGYTYLRQLNVSYEARHYRVIGILIIPGIVYLLSRLRLGYRVLFGLVWAGITFSSLHYLVKGYSFNRKMSAYGSTGLGQPFIDQAALQQVIAFDEQQHNAIFAFINNSIGLEIRHNRIITLEQISDYDHINIEDYEYDGHAGPLYIVLPATYSPKTADTILKFFPEYHNFNEIRLSERYVLYSAK